MKRVELAAGLRHAIHFVKRIRKESDTGLMHFSDEGLLSVVKGESEHTLHSPTFHQTYQS